MMDERDEILIQRYLARELTETEQAELDQRRKTDSQFDQQLAEYDKARQALLLSAHGDLRNRFRGLDRELDAGQTGPSKNNRTWLWGLLVAAGILLIGFTVWTFFFNHHQTSEPVLVKDTDSTKLEQTKTVQDSLHQKSPENQNAEKEKGKQDKEQNSPSENNQHKGSELFAENFEPYQDAMMDPTTRGDSEPTPLDLFRQAYWNGDYKNVEPLFEKLDAGSQQNDNYRFQVANALLETGKTDEAVLMLESIIKNNKSKYVTEAYLCLGMGYLNQGQNEKAKKEIETYLKSEKAKENGKKVGEKVLKEL